jgi:hypothetical protein
MKADFCIVLRIASFKAQLNSHQKEIEAEGGIQNIQVSMCLLLLFLFVQYHHRAT